jgi:hypothetical protein
MLAWNWTALIAVIAFAAGCYLGSLIGGFRGF